MRTAVIAPSQLIAGAYAYRGASAAVCYMPVGQVALEPSAFGMVFEKPFANATTVVHDDSPVAKVEIRGPLEHHENFFFDSYDAIKSRVANALKSSAKCVLLSIDSPGGAVSGCFDTVTELRRMSAEAGKPIHAYVDGQACSAALAIAFAATQVHVPPTGIVGSIGVFETLIDRTAQDAAIGEKYTMISSGARKLDGNPHTPVSDEAIEARKALVDATADQFFALVSKYRNISIADVAAMNGAMFCGQKAIDVGLADTVATEDQVMALLAAEAEGTGSPLPVAANVGEKTMDYKEAIAALRKCAEGDDEDAKKAKRALSAWDEEPKKDEPKKNEAKATSDPEPKPEEKKDEAKAAAPPADKDPDKDGDVDAKALASSVVQLGETVRNLQAKETARAEASERSQLLASRPDMAPEVDAFYAKQPLALMRAAYQAPDKGGLPRGPGKGKQVGAAMAAAAAMPTVPGSANPNPPDAQLGTGGRSNMSGEGDYIDQIMGLAHEANPIRCEGNRLVMSMLTPDHARELIQKGAAK